MAAARTDRPAASMLCLSIARIIWGSPLVVGQETELEELRRALRAEAIELAISVRKTEVQNVGHVPVRHRGQAPELSSLVTSVVEVVVGHVENELDRSGSSCEHRFLG